MLQLLRLLGLLIQPHLLKLVSVRHAEVLLDREGLCHEPEDLGPGFALNFVDVLAVVVGDEDLLFEGRVSDVQSEVVRAEEVGEVDKSARRLEEPDDLLVCSANEEIAAFCLGVLVRLPVEKGYGVDVVSVDLRAGDLAPSARCGLLDKDTRRLVVRGRDHKLAAT